MDIIEKKKILSRLSGEGAEHTSNRLLLLKRLYYAEDIAERLDKVKSIDEIYALNDDLIASSIDSFTCLNSLFPFDRNALKKIATTFSRLVELVEGEFAMYMYEGERKLDLVIETSFLPIWDECMDYIRYVTQEASKITIDRSEECSDFIITATYELK